MPARRTWRWLAGHPWVTSLVMVAVLTVAAGWRDFERDAEQDAFVACVAEWADATAARSGQLAPARARVDEANDALWRTMAQLLAEPRPDSREVFRGQLDRYKEASDAYRSEIERNPLPPPPKLQCGR